MLKDEIGIEEYNSKHKSMQKTARDCCIQTLTYTYNFFIFKYYTFQQKNLQSTWDCIFWCVWEPTSKNLPKSKLDRGILIFHTIYLLQERFLPADVTYINKR